jgi:hypothetical protein
VTTADGDVVLLVGLAENARFDAVHGGPHGGGHVGGADAEKGGPLLVHQDLDLRLPGIVVVLEIHHSLDVLDDGAYPRRRPGKVGEVLTRDLDVHRRPRGGSVLLLGDVHLGADDLPLTLLPHPPEGEGGLLLALRPRGENNRDPGRVRLRRAGAGEHAPAPSRPHVGDDVVHVAAAAGDSASRA